MHIQRLEQNMDRRRLYCCVAVMLVICIYILYGYTGLLKPNSLQTLLYKINVKELRNNKGCGIYSTEVSNNTSSLPCTKLILYNRVPKCASTTIGALIR